MAWLRAALLQQQLGYMNAVLAYEMCVYAACSSDFAKAKIDR